MSQPLLKTINLNSFQHKFDSGHTYRYDLRFWLRAFYCQSKFTIPRRYALQPFDLTLPPLPLPPSLNIVETAAAVCVCVCVCVWSALGGDFTICNKHNLWGPTCGWRWGEKGSRVERGQSWALSVFFYFFHNKGWFFGIFYKDDNLFLHQSYLKSPLPVKLTW